RSRYQDQDSDDPAGSDAGEKERYGKQGQQKKPAWETVLGFGTDGLGTLLSPVRTFHKRRFEMTLDQMVFLGWPVFIREDGGWRKRRDKTRKRRSVDNSGEDKVENTIKQEKELSEKVDVEVNEELGETSGHDIALEESESNVMSEEAQTKDEKITTTAKRKDSMTMFNVVFVMNPPALEYQLRVREMYDYVVRKFSRALKWEQARSDYIWKESKQILKLKEKAKETETPASILYNQILSQSSLAKAISTLYSSISKSCIAQIHLSPTLSLSVQIPTPTSTSILPTPTEPQMPGLWLTTATSVPDDPTTESTNLAHHFALLLLDDEATILKDIELSAGEMAGPLTHYIRSTTPTKSFVQISTIANIPLQDIQFLASHLIYWRRARAIPPIHQRDTYIVSPNADMRRLSTAIPLYAATFPTLPSLPKMLSMLSGTPKPYSALIPSKDHKAAYFDILAWLLGGGWVTQLRTFAWIRVPAEVKAAVAAEMEREAAAAEDHNSPPQQPTTISSRRRRSSIPSSSDQNDDPGPPDLPSGYLSPPHHSRSSSSFENASISSTPNPADPHSLSFPPTKPQLPSPSTFKPSIILNPHKSLSLESRYITHISSSTTAFLPDQETRDAWPLFVKYFNGQHALEKIAVREGWKRNKVAGVLGKMEGAGVLVLGRFW
ncbi:MAG: Nitrogen permease regulator 3, partial [Pleopsidium flavum]